MQLLELGAVVDDRRGPRERLHPVGVLGMEVRARHEQPPIACERAGVREHPGAVAGAHRGVDDERVALAQDDADVRDERDAPVRDHEHALLDLDGVFPEDRCGRRCGCHLGGDL